MTLSLDTGCRVEGVTIFVVVDHLTKSTHFSLFPINFTAAKTAELFVDMVIKIHGFPSSIVILFLCPTFGSDYLS